MKKVLVFLLCLTLVFSVFAGCDNNADTSSADNISSKEILNNDDLIDKETGEIINIGSSTTMKITPEEIGELSNPVVTGLEAWPDPHYFDWKEEAYGLIYNYEKCDGNQRNAKLVSAFVSGDAYDVIKMTSGDFPVLALKGLLQPLEKIFPVYDENYFNQEISNFFTLHNRCYGVNTTSGIDKYGVYGINIYGVHYNQTFFDIMGEDTPMDYYERGEWTFDTFYKMCRSIVEYYPVNFNFTYLCQSSIAANDGEYFTIEGDTATLNLKDEKTMQALEWVSKMYALSTGNVHEGYDQFTQGVTAIHIERSHQINHFRANSNYEFGWVPFPTGPSGTGTQSGLADAWGIGKGAKNIEGAMTFIAANAYRTTWYEITNKEVQEGEKRTEEEFALINKALENSIVNSLDGFEISFYNFNQDAQTIGYTAAIEKYSPTFQAKLDEIMGTKKEVGAIEFEDQGVFNFDTAQSEYPFVNVIADDKITYGTDSIQSLKIDLTGVDSFSPILYTKPELFKLQNGGQYKVSFKLYSEVDLPLETLAVAARTTDALDGAPTFGLTWLDAKADQISEAEVYINVNADFTGDLAIVLLGSESVQGLSLIIDDFRVELISGE